MIPRPTVLLLPLACLLVSGAGKYPWLAVAGIYAIPVAWNLVVIAGHTGFHVIPAVVYAPVFDWFTLYISAGGPNPYADSWYMLAKFFYALVVAVAIVAIIWVWQSVIARVRYRREVR